MNNRMKQIIGLLLVVAMLIGHVPVITSAAESASDVLLDTTYTVAGTSAFQYWEVDFKAGEVYTITASWNEAPAVTATETSVKSAWKISTVSSSSSREAIDTIFLASIKKGSLISNYAVKGYQGIFVPTQDTSWMNLYFNYFNCVGNIFSIKVEKGNHLGTLPAAGQELVYEAYIDVGANTTYMHGYSSLNLEAGVAYNVDVNWDSAPAYAQQTGGSAWKVSAMTGINTESGTEMLKALNNASDAKRQSGSGTYIPASASTYLNFFVQRFGAADNRAHVTITKPAATAPDNGLTISVLGDSISTYTGISSGTAASTTNSTIANNAVYYTAGRFGVYQADTWWQQAADALGAKVLVNNAWSGSCLLTTQGEIPNAYDNRCVQLHDNTGTNSGEEPDIIAVYLGTNDYCRFPDTLGNAADINYDTLITAQGKVFKYATPTTTAEAYAIMLHKLTQRYPNSEIYCFTVLTKPDMTTDLTAQIEGLNATIKAVADKYDAYVVDLYNDTGIEDDAFFQTYVPKTDGRNILHPGPAGMDAITNCFLSAIYANSKISGIGNEATYNVSYELTDAAVLQGTAKKVLGGKSFACDLITKSGYALDVQVTMGGTDITSTAYANGKISVDNVSGDIVIKAKGEEVVLAEDVLLDTTWTQSHTTGHYFWDVDFKAGEVYTITANWSAAPQVSTNNTIKTGWMLATTTGNTGDQGAIDTIFMASPKSGATIAKGFQGVFIPTQDKSYLDLYIQSFAATGNTFSIKVEKGNKLGTTVATGKELVYDAYVDVAANTAYLNCYFDANLQANTKYYVSATWDPTPAFNGVSSSAGSAWKVTTVSTYNKENDGDNIIVSYRRPGVDQSGATAEYTPSVDRKVLNFFTQSFAGTASKIHIVITKDGSSELNQQVNVTTTDTAEELVYNFEQGKTYKVTATWNAAPTFPAGQKGWSLTTGTTAADGDLVILANTGKTYGEKVASAATVIFTATENASKLYLDATGITADNKVTVTAEPVDATENRVVDVSVTIPAGTRYTNVYTDASFVSGNKYDYSVNWTNQPTHSANSVRAWKIQTVSSTAVDGAGDGWYVGPKSANGVSTQTASGSITDAVTSSVFNLFTQQLKDENTVHIAIDKYVAPVLPDTSDLNTKISVTPEEAKYFAYNFQAGKTYKVTAQWDSAPNVSGSLANWQLQTVSDLLSTNLGDIVVKAARQNVAGASNITSYYQGTFTASAAMSYLKLTTTGLTAANNITVKVEEVTLDEGVVYEATINLDAGLPWLHTWTSLKLASGQWYKYSVDYASAPSYTSDNEGKTAWKLHIPSSETNVDNVRIYTNSAYASGSIYTATQNFSDVKKLSAAGELIGFFTQRTSGTNTVTIKIEKAEEPQIVYPYEVEDKVTLNKALTVPTGTSICINDPNGVNGTYCTQSHPMQAFDIYDDIVFVTYDGGYVMTFDLHTGEKISEFLMGCAISHEHHCGNAMFGTAKYDPNDRFPLLYSSGDLSTKACYVERILTDENGKPIGSQLIQWINFDMGIYAGANGAQAVVDPGNNRILFQQRKYGSISLVNSAFVIGEYPLPAHAEGTLVQKGGLEFLEVNLTVSDFLKPAYELPYWSPMYQGADYYDNQLLQTHGPTINGFGESTGLMTFKYAEDGSVTFSRYIHLTQHVGKTEPQCVAVWNGKLYISYCHGSGGYTIYDVIVDLGIDTTGSYAVLSAKDNDNLAEQIAAMVNKQLADAGKDYTVSNVKITANANGAFTADVTVKTPYTFQTVSVSGTVGDHSFTNYVSDNNATCLADGTKTALCDHSDCTASNTVADTGSKKAHAMTHHEAVPSNCTEDGSVEYWSCSGCNKNFADEAGATVLDSILDPKDGHDLKKVDEVPAEAGKTGTKAHWKCQTCGKLFSDAEGKNEVEASDLVIPALGHAVEKETEAGAIIEGLENAVHGESYTFTVKLEEGYVKGENFKVMVNGKELKANADGSYTILSVTAKLEISVTGAIKADAIIPDTGDTFLLMPVLLLLTLSFAGLTVLAYKRKEF